MVHVEKAVQSLVVVIEQLAGDEDRITELEFAKIGNVLFQRERRCVRLGHLV